MRRVLLPFLTLVALTGGCGGEPPQNRPVEAAVALPATLSHLTAQEPDYQIVAYFSDGTRLPVTDPRVLTLSEAREQAFREAVEDSPWRDTPEVVAVAACESRHESDAIGDQGRAFGLLQIRADAWPDLARRYDLLDPHQNLLAGWEVYRKQGWAAWTCALQ